MPGFGRRILVVEDEPLMASLLAEVLEGQGFDARTAADGRQARLEVERFDPDAALLDIALGEGPSGVDLALILHRQRPDIALLFLTKYADARTAGVPESDIPPNCGFLRKDRVRDSAYLLESLEAVLADRPDRVRDDQDPAAPLAVLNAKQLDVLRMRALGYNNDFIARAKGAGISTVERWVIQIFRALDIGTHGDLNPRVEAVRRFVAASAMPERR